MVLILRGQASQHPPLDGVDGSRGGCGYSPALGRERGLQHAPVPGVRLPDDELLFLEVVQKLVHALRGDERPTCEVGVGQSRLLGQRG